MPKKNKKVVGKWAFLIGVLIAILIGLYSKTVTGGMSTFLVFLGILVGFLNISEKESEHFLIAAIALLLSGTAGLGNLPVIGVFLGPILQNITTFVAPSVVIVALKAIHDLAKE